MSHEKMVQLKLTHAEIEELSNGYMLATECPEDELTISIHEKLVEAVVKSREKR